MDGTWAYRGKDGRIFGPGIAIKVMGDPYGDPYGEGDTIGCGVNFKENTAFFTKNGRIVGTFLRCCFFMLSRPYSSFIFALNPL